MADLAENSTHDNQSSWWLPSHLHKLDQKVLSIPNIKSHLVTAPFAGIADQLDWPAVPEHLNIDEKSSPTQICTFLGWLLVTRIQPIRDFDIFIHAISFDNRKTQDKWYDRTGGATELCSNVDGFLWFAQCSILLGKKVVALANPYLSPKCASPSQPPAKREVCFLENKGCMGIGVLIRMMIRNARLCLQLVLFSPDEATEELRKSWGNKTVLADDWHKLFIKKTSEWASKIEYPLDEVYLGGKVNPAIATGRKLDSVRVAGDWIQDVAYNSTDAIPKDTVTDNKA